MLIEYILYCNLLLYKIENSSLFCIYLVISINKSIAIPFEDN